MYTIKAVTDQPRPREQLQWLDGKRLQAGQNENRSGVLPTSRPGTARRRQHGRTKTFSSAPRPSRRKGVHSASLGNEPEHDSTTTACTLGRSARPKQAMPEPREKRASARPRTVDRDSRRTKTISKAMKIAIVQAARNFEYPSRRAAKR